MPPRSRPQLTAPEMAALDAWISAGAPSATAECSDAGGGSDGGSPDLPCDPDQRIRPASKFSVPASPDLYACYGFDTTSDQKRHVIAAGPRIDNRRVVHHVLLYQAPRSVSPTPTPCNPGGALEWKLVTGWAPGGASFVLPEEAGFAEESGTTHWAVQIHYNNASLPDQTDETGFDLCTTKNLRRYDADVFATGTMSIDIPPRSTHTTECEFTVPLTFGRLQVVMAGAHMHRLGRAESAKRIRNGFATKLLDVPDFDFNDGAGLHPTRVELAPGDNVRTTCSWKNVGDSPVSYGEKTDNEMCFAFLSYYPKIRGPFSWVVPSSPGFSRCRSTSERAR